LGIVEVFDSESLAEKNFPILLDGNAHTRDLPVGTDLFDIGFDVGNILLGEVVLRKRGER
jgi:hypothetical protein